MLAFCTSSRFYEHLTGPHHPERPDRLRAIFAAVREAGLIDSPNPLPHGDLYFGLPRWTGQKLIEIAPRLATVEEVMLVHPPKYVDKVRGTCATGGVLDAGDTVVGTQSFDAAMLAVGACLRCVDGVMGGEFRRAFAALRPPGHHAEPEVAMGFCLFSNVAIAARYLQQKHGVGRIAIVDFDVHHGNGTQLIFQADPNVFFVSIHEDPHIMYPGTGYRWEIGASQGKGYTLNLPLPPRSGDRAYLEAMRNSAIPKLMEFRPEFLLISAGFDAHRDDPLADMEVTEEGFGEMTRMLMQVADECCRGRVVSVLEGGYNLRALGRSVVRHLAEMAR